MSVTPVNANVVLIRELLTKQDMNIKQLAEKVGCTREMMSRLINKRSAMTLERCQQIADVLGVPYETLLSTTESLLMRRFEQIMVKFAISDASIQVKIPELFDVAVRLGF